MSTWLSALSAAAWWGVIAVGLFAIFALSTPGRRTLSRLAAASTPDWLIRALALVVQILAVVPTLWHIWLVGVSRREASLGHGEQALFAAIGDPVVMRVAMVLGRLGANPSVEMLNVIAITTWIIIGAAVIVTARQVGRLALNRPAVKHGAA